MHFHKANTHENIMSERKLFEIYTKLLSSNFVQKKEPAYITTENFCKYYLYAAAYNLTQP